MSTHEITYVREVTARYSSPRKAPEHLYAPGHVASFCRRLLRDNVREHFIALYLGPRNEVLAYQVVSIGCADQALVHPREVFQPAVLVGAVSVIVAHNHPSGNVSTSVEDDELTRRLHAAGKLLGIRLVDHVVFTHESCFSYDAVWTNEDFKSLSERKP